MKKLRELTEEDLARAPVAARRGRHGRVRRLHGLTTPMRAGELRSGATMDELMTLRHEPLDVTIITGMSGAGPLRGRATCSRTSASS